jgi:hypothetical protein
MRDITPGYTLRSPRADESVAASNPPHATPGPESYGTMSSIGPTPETSDKRMGMQDLDVFEDDQESAESSNLDNGNLLFSLSINPNGSSNRAVNAYARDSNQVLFSFFHFTVPDNYEELLDYLSSLNTTGGITQAARHLLELLEDRTAVIITMNGVHHLEDLWTRTRPETVDQDDYPIRSRILFHTYLQSEDWQIVRTISCFTCSQSALQKLAVIAGSRTHRRTLLTSDWSPHRCPCLIAQAQSLRSLWGKESLFSSAKNLALHLETYVDDKDHIHFTWAAQLESGLDETMLGFGAQLDENHHSPRFTRGVYQSTLLEDLVPGRLAPPFLSPLLGIPLRFGVHGAIMLKKPVSWPSSSPLFCLMVLEGDIKDDDGDGVAQMAARVCGAGDFYDVNPGIGLSQLDESMIGMRTENLFGQRAGDTT